MKIDTEHLTGDKLDLFKTHMDAFGGFFDVDLLAKKMKIEKKAIFDMIANKELVGFYDENKNLMIPACQIHNFKLVEGLKEIFNSNKEKSYYDKMMFLTTYNNSIKNSPIRELQKEMDRTKKKGSLEKILNL